MSDDERREVARRLRRAWANVPDRNPARHHMRVLYEIYTAVGLNDDGADAIDLFDRLADLIEPGCDRDTPQKVAEEMFGKMRHSTKEEADAYEAMLKSKSVEIHPVDRDALLALEDEMFEDATGLAFISQLEKNEELQDLQSTMAKALMDYARRIREALGVES